MRTIKFRGKANDGRWIYGGLVYSDNIEPAIYFEVGNKVFRMVWAYVDPATVGQFTGLYDKNHNEIYEGDILAVQGIDEKLEVRFVRGVFAFLWNGDLDNECPTGSPTHEWAEVVGNIHDNPDLIEKGGDQ